MIAFTTSSTPRIMSVLSEIDVSSDDDSELLMNL